MQRWGLYLILAPVIGLVICALYARFKDQTDDDIDPPHYGSFR